MAAENNHGMKNGTCTAQKASEHFAGNCHNATIAQLVGTVGRVCDADNVLVAACSWETEVCMKFGILQIMTSSSGDIFV